jgi:hypothetical protein
LKQVQRVKDAEQQTAFNQMHEGEFLEALQTFEKKGGLHWTDKQKDTLKDMAARYSADVAAAPDKQRFMFAITNKDVASLNQHARALHRARGDLGADHSLPTAHGMADFATGDRIQFTGNGRTKGDRLAGLTNGRVGTVTALEINHEGKERITVTLDAAKGDKPQEVTFVVGHNSQAGEFNSIKHGYAGTIYRGQGRTLDEVYVGHSAQWRSAASYVALTRHRESVHIFAARETVRNLEAMAEGMARTENTRAATAYSIDPRSGFGMIAGDLTARQPAAVAELAADRSADTNLADRAQAAAARVTQAFGNAADETGRAAKKVTRVAGRTVDATVPPAARILGGAASGVARVAEGAARLAEGAVEALASLFGGGSSAPAPQQEQHEQQEQPKPRQAEPPPIRQLDAVGKPKTIEEFRAIEQREQDDRAARVQELAHSLGASEAMSEPELQREQVEQAKRSRDRGGGISR